MKLLKGILVGGVLISTGQIFAQQVFAQQAVAEADTSSEIRLLKAKLKQLEQRVEDQGRKEKQIEAQANAAMPPAYVTVGIRSMSCRKGLLQGHDVDIRRLGRSHRHLPHP